MSPKITAASGSFSQDATYADVIDAPQDATWFKLLNPRDAELQNSEWIRRDQLDELSLTAGRYNVKAWGPDSGTTEWAGGSINTGAGADNAVQLAANRFDANESIALDQILDTSAFSTGGYVKVFAWDDGRTALNTGFIRPGQLSDFSLETGQAGSELDLFLDTFVPGAGRSGWARKDIAALNPGAGQGKTIELTSDSDQVSGTANDDEFIAATDTLNNSDVIDGGSGRDTLTAIFSDPTDGTDFGDINLEFHNPSMENVEVLNLRATHDKEANFPLLSDFHIFDGRDALDQGSTTTGLEEIWSDGSSNNVGAEPQEFVTVGARNSQAEHNYGVAMPDDVVRNNEGKAILNNVELVRFGIGGVGDGKIDAESDKEGILFETMNIEVRGDSSIGGLVDTDMELLQNLDSPELRTLDIAGEGELSIDARLAGVTEINATDNSGGVDLTLDGNGVTMVGSSADDQIVATAPTEAGTGNTFALGAGDDRVELLSGETSARDTFLYSLGAIAGGNQDVIEGFESDSEAVNGNGDRIALGEQLLGLLTNEGTSLAEVQEDFTLGEALSAGETNVAAYDGGNPRAVFGVGGQSPTSQDDLIIQFDLDSNQVGTFQDFRIKLVGQAGSDVTFDADTDSLLIA